jgi:riboflavin kinase/FMN adenylyltransferase
LPRKIELIQKFGIDAMFVLKTNEQLLWQAAETFFTETLKEKLSAKILIEGSNFSFGWKRSGNAEFLCRTGQQAGIEIELVEPIEQDGNPVSSSIVRRLLQNGNVENANRLLTEPYQLTGTVAVGQQRGRTLGFPTANLEDVETIIPLGGVYASAVNVGGQQHLATTHIGSNITFGQAEPTIESFIHNFTGDLYGKQLNVVLYSRIRGSQKFDSVDELVAQMEKDVESTSCRC